MFTRYLSIILFGSLLLGCVSDVSNQTEQHIKKTIIFVPGFKGSKLAEADGSVVWVNFYQAIFGNRSLALPLPELSIANADLHSVGVLDEVGVVPWLYSYNVYGQFLRNLGQRLPADTELISFDYDWRREIPETAQSLGRLVEQKKAQGRTISIVAHSMGGLVSTYYLRYGMQPLENAIEDWSGAARVTEVVFAGVPFLGSLEIFDDMLIGGETGLNKTLLSAEAYGTFPSSYMLLPAPGSKTFFPEVLDLYEPHNWSDSKWGIFSGSLDPSIFEARVRYCDTVLTRAKLFWNLLMQGTEGDTPPLRILNLYGAGRPTKTEFFRDPSSGAFDFSKAHTEDGDRVVSVVSSKVPSYLKDQVTLNVPLKADHGGLLSDEEALRSILKFFKIER